MPGVQDQYVRDAGPDSDELLSSDEPQAASAVPPSVTAMEVATRRRSFVFGMDLSPLTWAPACCGDRAMLL
jgi:hypothetical protein